MIYVGAARSQAERAAALVLANAAFLLSAQAAEDLARSVVPDEIVVLSKDDEVIGMLRLIERLIYRGAQKFPCVCIANVCIAPGRRGQGLSRELMAGALSTAAHRGFELS